MCDLASSRHIQHASRSGSYTGSPAAPCSTAWSIEIACTSEEQGHVRQLAHANRHASAADRRGTPRIAARAPRCGASSPRHGSPPPTASLAPAAAR
eukprot:scaffold104841_cov63-Phaeocystis_antarctica.AAC.3